MITANILRLVNHDGESKANIAAYAPINMTTNVKQYFKSVSIVFINRNVFQFAPNHLSSISCQWIEMVLSPIVIALVISIGQPLASNDASCSSNQPSSITDSYEILSR